MIAVNDYVRDKNGRIGKVTKIDKALRFNLKTSDGELEIENILWLDTNYDFLDEKDTISEDNIVSSSILLIDLIQVGDYVNGQKVLRTGLSLEYTDDDAETGVSEIDNGLELENQFIYFSSQIETVKTGKYEYKVN